MDGSDRLSCSRRLANNRHDDERLPKPTFLCCPSDDLTPHTHRQASKQASRQPWSNSGGAAAAGAVAAVAAAVGVGVAAAKWAGESIERNTRHVETRDCPPPFTHRPHDTNRCNTTTTTTPTTNTQLDALGAVRPDGRQGARHRLCQCVLAAFFPLFIGPVSVCLCGLYLCSLLRRLSLNPSVGTPNILPHPPPLPPPPSLIVHIHTHTHTHSFIHPTTTTAAGGRDVRRVQQQGGQQAKRSAMQQVRHKHR